jgi:glycine betaine catabolism A
MNRVREPLAAVQPGLPASWYRDPAHYERELEAFWYRKWIACAREEELPAPGDWKVVRLGTQSLVLLKGDDDRLSAFHNTCRHRGSVLCTEERGSFPRGRIVCPYHAWTYDLAGKLVATPRRMDTPDFRLADYPLYEVAVDAWGGFVFVNLDRNAGPLAAAVGDRAQRYERYALNELKVGKRIVLDVQANWKLLAENFSECFHCPPVHPEFCRIVTAYQEAGAWGLRGAPEPRPEYRAGAQTLTLDGTARLPPFSRLTDEEKTKLYTADMVLPNLFLNLHPDYVNSQLMFPTGPQSVRMVYEWLFEPRHLPLSEADLQHYVSLWDITNRQDAQNCEWQQEGLQSREFRHGVYVAQEFDAHRFAQWVRDEVRDEMGSGHPSSPPVR